MKCPNCNETLVMTDRQGIEIDYCPKCRGVWLDKGELDKLIERSSAYPGQKDSDHFENEKRYDPYKGQHHDPNYKYKKKKGFLGDFFDFD